MANTFQIEFPLSQRFQSCLASLTESFLQVSGQSVTVNAIAGMCLQALSDITPALVDEYLFEEDKARVYSTNDVKIFQKTTNLDAQDRKHLDAIKLNLLVTFKREVSRRDIMLTILFTASELKMTDIEYIYSEYQ